MALTLPRSTDLNVSRCVEKGKLGRWTFHSPRPSIQAFKQPSGFINGAHLRATLGCGGLPQLLQPDHRFPSHSRGSTRVNVPHDDPPGAPHKPMSARPHPDGTPPGTSRTTKSPNDDLCKEYVFPLPMSVCTNPPLRQLPLADGERPGPSRRPPRRPSPGPPRPRAPVGPRTAARPRLPRWPSALLCRNPPGSGLPLPHARQLLSAPCPSPVRVPDNSQCERTTSSPSLARSSTRSTSLFSFSDFCTSPVRSTGSRRMSSRTVHRESARRCRRRPSSVRKGAWQRAQRRDTASLWPTTLARVLSAAQFSRRSSSASSLASCASSQVSTTWIGLSIISTFSSDRRLRVYAATHASSLTRASSSRTVQSAQEPSLARLWRLTRTDSTFSLGGEK
ncbi:hypothetical protein VUR80DRAFT_7556 [Thermomyces stellatus]